MDVVVAGYALAKLLPREEAYRLWSQVTRSAVSIPANIAEGHSRGTRRDYAQFISIALGSLAETETLIAVMLRLGYIQESECAHAQALATETARMLESLRTRLRQHT
jgi:four helix bundle protein